MYRCMQCLPNSGNRNFKDNDILGTKLSTVESFTGKCFSISLYNISGQCVLGICEMDVFTHILFYSSVKDFACSVS